MIQSRYIIGTNLDTDLVQNQGRSLNYYLNLSRQNARKNPPVPAEGSKVSLLFVLVHGFQEKIYGNYRSCKSYNLN